MPNTPGFKMSPVGTFTCTEGDIAVWLFNGIKAFQEAETAEKINQSSPILSPKSENKNSPIDKSNNSPIEEKNKPGVDLRIHEQYDVRVFQELIDRYKAENRPYAKTVEEICIAKGTHPFMSAAKSFSLRYFDEMSEGDRQIMANIVEEVMDYRT